MARHVFAQSPDAQAFPTRRQVSLVRRDLLLLAETVNPRTGEVVDLPMPAGGFDGGNGALIGPSAALSLVRRVVSTEGLPPSLREQAKARAGGVLPQHVAVWSLLDPANLWRTGDLPPPREPGQGEQEEPEHPFRRELVTGGTPLPEPASESWLPVRKNTTAWVSDGAFRLAAAMHGSADAGAERIGELAAAAWERDVERCLELHGLVGEAPEGLLETEDVLALRPASSVSQEVERAVLEEALRWLGVDPSEELKRTPGRRRKAGQDGDVVVVDVDGEGRVHGHLRRPYGGWGTATALTDIPAVRLVELLGLLRTDGLRSDADLLEAYLDAAHPAWRDIAAEEPAGAAAASDAWEVLGLPRGASREEVVAAYRTIMKKVHPDVAGLPSWVSRAVADAYRSLKEAA